MSRVDREPRLAPTARVGRFQGSLWLALCLLGLGLAIAAAAQVFAGLARARRSSPWSRAWYGRSGRCRTTWLFRGEEQDLQEMLGNLLDNARKWAARRVEISARIEPGRLEIRLDDDGGIVLAARPAD